MGNSNGKPPACKHTALDRFADLAQVAVAGIELAVSVADADERTRHVGGVVAHGGGKGAVGQAGDAVFVEEGLAAGGGFGSWGLASFSLFYHRGTEGTEVCLLEVYRKAKNLCPEKPPHPKHLPHKEGGASSTTAGLGDSEACENFID